MYDETNQASSVDVNLLISQEKDDLGYEHFRWQQTIGNIPVENAIYLQHVVRGWDFSTG